MTGSSTPDLARSADLVEQAACVESIVDLARTVFTGGGLPRECVAYILKRLREALAADRKPLAGDGLHAFRPGLDRDVSAMVAAFCEEWIDANDYDDF